MSTLPDADTLRIHIYDCIVSDGRIPSVRELSADFQVSPDAVRQAIVGLRVGKTMLSNPHTGEIWMAGPFSSSETPYRVAGATATWWANCAWDMLGVAMIAGEPVHIEAECGDCRAPITLDASPDRPPDSDAVVHFLVPARQWYDDIGFT